MIKTSYKNKLPQGMSYPVGAEILSNALVGVPQYENLEISFRFSKYVLTKKRWGHSPKTEQQSDIFVLSVYRSIRFNYWNIVIRSIPSTHKKQVSEQLIAQVLPELQQRLIKAGSDAEHFNFNASFSLATGELKIL